jgi:hypothetical protein
MPAGRSTPSGSSGGFASRRPGAIAGDAPGHQHGVSPVAAAAHVRRAGRAARSVAPCRLWRVFRRDAPWCCQLLWLLEDPDGWHAPGSLAVLWCGSAPHRGARRDTPEGHPRTCAAVCRGLALLCDSAPGSCPGVTRLHRQMLSRLVRAPPVAGWLQLRVFLGSRVDARSEIGEQPSRVCDSLSGWPDRKIP